MKVTIQRSMWLRGEGSAESRLYRSDDGLMCCLGFCGLELGLRPTQMAEIAYLYSCLPTSESNIKWLTGVPEAQLINLDSYYGELRTRAEQILTQINDAEGVEDEIREAWLIEGFRIMSGGSMEVEFVD